MPSLVLVILLGAFAAAALAPGQIAVLRRARNRVAIRVLAATAMALPAASIVLVGVTNDEAMVGVLLEVLVLGVVVWIAAMVWAMVGKSGAAEMRGFAILPKAPPAASPTQDSPRQPPQGNS
jgi:hypothetical protein